MVAKDPRHRHRVQSERFRDFDDWLVMSKKPQPIKPPPEEPEKPYPVENPPQPQPNEDRPLTDPVPPDTDLPRM
jgi:hypothetical protein